MEAADNGFVGLWTQIPAIQRLVRIVAALPPHQFMPLDQAFAKAKSYLGSSDLAARDLTQHARGRRLTVAARRIFPDGTEQVLILRRAYWRYFAILPPSSDSGMVRVRGRIILPGVWYCFVGRRRFDRLYSTAPPSVPAVQKPTARQVAAIEWITREARRLKRTDKIPAGIKMTPFAKMLATNLEEAARTDRSISIKPVGWRHILNKLKKWGLWPIDAIE